MKRMIRSALNGALVGVVPAASVALYTLSALG